MNAWNIEKFQIEKMDLNPLQLCLEFLVGFFVVVMFYI